MQAQSLTSLNTSENAPPTVQSTPTPSSVPPAVLLMHGVEHCVAPDSGALSADQDDVLLQLLHSERLADRDYLRTHSDVQAILELIAGQVEKHRPDDLHEYLSEYFRQPIDVLRLAVQQQKDVTTWGSCENLVDTLATAKSQSSLSAWSNVEEQEQIDDIESDF